MVVVIIRLGYPDTTGVPKRPDRSSKDCGRLQCLKRVSRYGYRKSFAIFVATLPSRHHKSLVFRSGSCLVRAFVSKHVTTFRSLSDDVAKCLVSQARKLSISRPLPLSVSYIVDTVPHHTTSHASCTMHHAPCTAICASLRVKSWHGQSCPGLSDTWSQSSTGTFNGIIWFLIRLSNERRSHRMQKC